MRLRWLLLAASLPAAADPVRLDCTADTSICLHEGERARNLGAKSHLRVKGIEHILLLAFDLRPANGKVVEEARLFLHATGEHQLKTVGVSTVSSLWVEGAGTDRDAGPGESCFLEAERGRRAWAGPGSDFLGASFGAGGSLWRAVELREEAEGWFSLEVPPAFVHAMLEGNAFGLAVSDEKGQTRANNDVYSREQRGSAPYLSIVKWREGAAPPSGARKFEPAKPVEVRDRSDEILRHAPPTPAEPPAGPSFRILHECEWRADAPSAPLLRDGEEILLHAARGEHVGFMVRLDAEGRVRGDGWSVSRVRRVGRAADPLEPGDAGPALLHVERYVPKDAAPGVSKLAIEIAGRQVPVALHVHRAVLPDALSFHVSLNAYSSPGRLLGDAPGSDPFLALERSFHRLAHAHRATIAVVPYSHHGRVLEGFAPEVRDGRIASWDAWDARWGPYFDGSAFRGLPRDGVPVGHFYLPHHESWPLPIRAHYLWKGSLADHWKGAPPVEEAFPKAYADAFRASLVDAARHFSERRWAGTEFQFYLNNKNTYWKKDRDSCWWLLDEPAYRDDFLALRYFASLARDAAKDVPGSPVRFRLDLSRPQWRREHLDGLVGTCVVSGTYREYPDRVFGRGEAVWTYGALAPPGAPPEAPRAWIWQAFLDGCDGLVPWQTLGDAEAWEKAVDTAVLLPPQAGMPREACATLRLKSLRRGQQDVELLRLLLDRLKATRAEVRGGLAKRLGLAGAFRRSSEDDAGAVDFERLNGDEFERVRRAILVALDDP